MSPRRRPLLHPSSLLCVSALLVAAAVTAQTPSTAHLTVAPNDIVHPVSPNLYGMMTEEINHAFEGGLYPELVQNRTFRGAWEGINHWDLVRRGNSSASMELDKSTGPSKALPTSVKLTVTTASANNEAGMSNTGYWGMGLRPNTQYRGSFYAKLADGTIDAVLLRLISDDTGAVLAEASVPLHASDWSQYQYTLSTGALKPSSNNHLEVLVAHPGTLNLQLVSLMPPTFHDRPNGFRPDLMQRMAELHPTFLRLPGGNYLEGDQLKDWYWSDDGLGFLEFLDWCEDLKIEPLLAVYAGYALQGAYVKPGPDLEPYVQSALDEIEYVTGDTNTKWGAERAKDGHPAPFPLHYVEIGNEDWFDKSASYDARFAQFATALRKRYPQLKLIATAKIKDSPTAVQPDIIDDHYYKPVGDMLDFTHHYDNAPRTGPKIFVGEWATLSGTPTPNWGGALADAAWMTSMERNSDLIVMASYAPLLVNVNPGASQWYTNMIGYDANSSYGSPSYYAQSMFGGHLGDGLAKTSIDGAGDRFFYSATVDTKAHTLHLKLVNASSQAQPLTLDLQGATGSNATLTTLHAASYDATNSINKPDFIHPITAGAKFTGAHWTHTVPALTIEVVDVPFK